MYQLMVHINDIEPWMFQQYVALSDCHDYARRLIMVILNTDPDAQVALYCNLIGE